MYSLLYCRLWKFLPLPVTLGCGLFLRFITYNAGLFILHLYMRREAHDHRPECPTEKAAGDQLHRWREHFRVRNKAPLTLGVLGFWAESMCFCQRSQNIQSQNACSGDIIFNYAILPNLSQLQSRQSKSHEACCPKEACFGRQAS